ncbi:hypothetical protein FACS189411_16140 [Bacteroidia bacterium]|nr:hypothetical protein FACS189411_16140 [Bacteroidia bacterium]
MSAIYNLFKNPNPKTGDDKKNDRIHARLVNQNIIRIEHLVELVSNFTSFSSGDVKGVLAALRQVMVITLKSGGIVELEGLGTFSISLKSISATTEKEVTPSKVRFKKLVFRCAKDLRKEFRGMNFERADEASRLDTYPAETRKANILQYIEKHNTISSAQCQNENKCTKYLALKDLKSLYEEGKIIRLGTRHNAQYALPADE